MAERLGRTGSNAVTAFIPDLEDVSKISAGNAFSLALNIDGTLWSRGYNNQGQHGYGTKVQKTSPVEISGLSNWSSKCR